MIRYDGKLHWRDGVLTLIILAGITAPVAPRYPVPAAGFFCGLFLGLVAGPDMDLRRMTYSKRRMPRWWRIIWWPYGRLMRHRGWSHTVPQGTLSRLFYLLIIPEILLIFSLSQLGEIEWQALAYYQVLFLVPCSIAWMIQDLIHLRRDGLLRKQPPWVKPTWQPPGND